MPASAIRRKPKSRWKVLAVAATLLLLLVGWLGTANYLAWAVMTDVQTPMFWAAPAFGWLPHYGSDIVAASDLIDFSFELSTATNETLTAFEPLLNEPAWRWLVCCPSFWDPRRPVRICC